MRNLMLRAARGMVAGKLPRTSAGGNVYQVQTYSGLHDDMTDFDQMPHVLDIMGIQGINEEQVE